MRILFFVLVLFQFSGFTQSKNPDEIINNVIKKFNQIKDYQVDVDIKVDIEFLKVPESNAKIYFKQPDKVHLESEGFAILPKDGLDFSPSYLAKKDYTAIYEREVDLNGYTTSVVKIIPTGDKGNVILSSLWIDQKKNVIRKVETTTKTNGTFSMDFYFDEKFVYPLPQKIVFSFNLDQLNMPKMFGEESSGTETKKKKGKLNSTTKGQVVVNYSNYKVNSGIPDSIFEDKEKKDSDAKK
jgi:outer membrane lipoprotein-sorting protein